jgi:hypothetical protein
MCRLSEALVVAGCHAPGFASLHLVAWCHASGVGCLRRNCVKPVLTRKNFGRAGSSVEAANPIKIFRAFRAFRGQKMGCGRQPTPSLPCFPWLKNCMFRRPCNDVQRNGTFPLRVMTELTLVRSLLFCQVKFHLNDLKLVGWNNDTHLFCIMGYRIS